MLVSYLQSHPTSWHMLLLFFRLSILEKICRSYGENIGSLMNTAGNLGAGSIIYKAKILLCVLSFMCWPCIIKATIALTCDTFYYLAIL